MNYKDKIEHTTITHLLLILANMHAANEFKIAELLKEYLWDDEEYKNILRLLKR